MAGGDDFSCRDMPLRRVGAGVGGVGSGYENRRNGEARRIELSFIFYRVSCLLMSVRNLTHVFADSQSCFECSYEFVVSL